ncbi:MAG: hypothetical protein JSS42_05410 [Proteobacteria bacterium]|nr:hypothetical protein [Pseudomonadota bacterium]
MFAPASCLRSPSTAGAQIIERSRFQEVPCVAAKSIVAQEPPRGQSRIAARSGAPLHPAPFVRDLGKALAVKAVSTLSCMTSAVCRIAQGFFPHSAIKNKFHDDMLTTLSSYRKLRRTTDRLRIVVGDN